MPSIPFLSAINLTDISTAPTAAVGTNTPQIATTEYVLANAGSGGGAGSSFVATFTNADLAANVLTVTHNLGVQYAAITVWDNNGRAVLPTEVTATSVNACAIDLSGLTPLTGTWRVSVAVGVPGPAGAPGPAGPGGVTSVGLSTSGVLFSVSGSPVTTSGTLTLSLLTQAANTVLAGPTAGAAATPTMRALVAADVPDLGASYARAITLNAAGVLHNTPATFSNDGAGTFTGTLTLKTQAANTVLAGPASGAAATPTMRALVAADVPTIATAQVTGLDTALAAKAPLAAPTFTGRPRFDAHTSLWKVLPAAVGGTITIDWSAGDRWYGTLASGATTLAYTGVPAAGQSQVLLLRLKQPASGAAGTVTWPAGTKHVGGVAPTLSTANGAVDSLSVSLDPGGTLYETFLMGANLS
jgi:hypothetical protein